ncbi:MAG: hypothetical protein L0099_15770 [Acidobacteria bacterium]|nr:hypothetical protein [Acidobacteriota bacterium]
MSAPSPATEQTPPARLAVRVGERAIALVLALLLLRSSFAHLGNPYYFLSSVYSYEIAGVDLGRWVAMVLPPAQMILAICLLTQWWLAEAYAMAAILFTAFLGFQGLVLWHGRDISCGCFGASADLQVGGRTLAVAGAAAVASALGWLGVAIRARKPACPLAEGAAL